MLKKSRNRPETAERGNMTLQTAETPILQTIYDTHGQGEEKRHRYEVKTEGFTQTTREDDRNYREMLYSIHRDVQKYVTLQHIRSHKQHSYSMGHNY